MLAEQAWQLKMGRWLCGGIMVARGGEFGYDGGREWLKGELGLSVDQAENAPRLLYFDA